MTVLKKKKVGQSHFKSNCLFQFIIFFTPHLLFFCGTFLHCYTSNIDASFSFPAMTLLTASICWNVLAHKSDDIGEVGVKIYQKPEGNEIYELRRKKISPLCKESENPDAAWYVRMKSFLHSIPIGIEQHGAKRPEQWAKRLESYPDWISNKEKLVVDMNHWNAVVNRSYLNGLGINWPSI
ncbi:probable methyltransferase PMT28 [Arachis ipaensis]|uniref:probable methyltransferase PMT28 n=1 Tax=Arachis ipaensis TaxID=130454 RepID=UPI000A2B143C|nr:probable methyltransferase PMT28 [Arachis ipaensis]